MDTFFVFHFLEPIAKPNILCTLKSVSFSYPSDEKKILKKINFQITGQQRIGLLGPNGTGKSTFMKLLAGRLQPQEGQYDKHDKLKIGYFTQHALDQLISQKSPLEHLQGIDSKATELEFRKFLGRFRFSGDKVFDPIGYFSGGEKARLALALIVWQRPNLLLLDEPTNHLDIDMCEALIAALKEFPGAVVVVSHDRYLLDQVVNEFYLVSNGILEPFSGSILDYEKALLKKRSVQSKRSAKDSEKKTANERKQNLKGSKNQIRSIEKELQALYEKKKSLELELSQITTMNSKTISEDLKKNRLVYKELEKSIQSLELKWIELNQ